MGNDPNRGTPGGSLTGALRDQLASLAEQCTTLAEQVGEAGVPLDALVLAELLVALDKTARRFDKLARRLRPGSPEKPA